MKDRFRIFWIGLAILIGGSAIAWFITGNVAMRHAQATMTRSAKEIEDNLLTSVDDLLFYVGNAIVRHYHSPQAMTADTVKEIMHRYDIDELNIVDEHGIVLAGDLATVGFDFNSSPNTRKFLRLLNGVYTYAQPFRAAVEDPNIVRKYAGIAFSEGRGFVQIGFDRKRMNGDVDYLLSKLSEGWTIGERGYSIIALRTNGRILSCGSEKWNHVIGGDKMQTLTGIGFDVMAIPRAPEQMFEQKLYGEDVYCIARNVGYYHRIVVVIPAEQIRDARRFMVAMVSSILLFVLIIAGFAVRWLTGVNDRLKQFIDEDRRRQETDAKRRAEELENAKIIQTESLPRVFPNESSFAIAAKMLTAREVGGDFYDFFRVPSGKLLFLIADTSGKGIPAALFMMKARALIKATTWEYESFVDCICEANERLAANNDASIFVTAWIGLYDEYSGVLEYVNAGHNAPLVKRTNGKVEWVKSRPGLALAAMEGIKYRAERIFLNPGDQLYLYTDGVTEAMNHAGELFGDERLMETLAAAGEGDLIESVYVALEKFVSGAEQSDDITMLSLKRK